MTQYHTLNLILSSLQLKKSGTKNGTEITLKISLNGIGDSNDENNFPDKLFVTNTQVLRLCKSLIIPANLQVIPQVI